MRTSVPSTMRTAPPDRVRARLTDTLLAADSITESKAFEPSSRCSTSVRYTWPDAGRDRSWISPRTHTSSRKVARTTLPMASDSSPTENVGSGTVPTAGSSNSDIAGHATQPV